MKSFAFGAGAAVFCIGASTTIGRIFGAVHMYQWDVGIGMALNTGIAFILTGAAICVLASRQSKHESSPISPS